MIGVLFALMFAAGVALLWFGGVCGWELPEHPAAALGRALARRGIGRELAAPTLAACAVGLLAGGLVFALARVPILAIAAGLGGGYAPVAWQRRRREGARRELERAWPAVLAQLADALEAGLAFPAAVELTAEAGPLPLRPDLKALHARLHAGGLDTALDGLAETGERTAQTVVLLLRAGLVELPAGRLAPLVRELSGVLAERFEAREKARSRAASLQVEAAILAVSPIVLLLLVGAASPGYLDAYRTSAGTFVAALAGVAIFGCYLLMRRLGRVPEPRSRRARRR